jgi:hypothetical protein
MKDRLEHIQTYLHNVKQANNESAKKELLKTLLVRLFDEDEEAQGVINAMSLGAERVVMRIPLPERIKTGRADTQYGNVIIEFEKDLAKTGDHAEEQLREYLAGNWNVGNDYAFTLIATDCIEWRILAPSYEDLVDTGVFQPDQVELTEVETFTLTEDNARDFYFFLDRFLFRTEPQRPTLKRIKQDFGETSPTYLTCIGRLAEHYADFEDDSEIQVAFEQWQRFLSIAYGEFRGGPRVFLVHTYLSVFAKILAYEVITGDDYIDRDALRGIVQGDIFDRLNVRNFIDNDFFNWVAHDEHFDALGDFFRAITRQVGNYAFTNVDEDVLKGVYQELIDLETRHGLGEYYTPDWLCERVVNEVDMEADSRVLDPACGSGSFLRAVIARLRREHPERSAADLAEQVVGIDIHPLSVQIAKTTVLLALGEKVKQEKQPVTLRVYLANTLRTPEGGFELFDSAFVMEIDRERYRMPLRVFEDSARFDEATSACEDLADYTLNEPDADAETLQNVLAKRGVDDLDDDLLGGFHDIYKGLKRAKHARRDGIWRFIIQNSYKPYFLKGQFDVVVGNPPWLTFSDVKKDSYQELLQTVAAQYGVVPERKELMTHLEIAAVFLAHVCNTFLKHRGQLAFVLPRSFFSADHHDNTRSGRVKGVGLDKLWDLDGVNPLFNVPSCVLFAHARNTTGGKPKDGVLGYRVKGVLPEHNLTWDEAKSCLTFDDVTWHLGKLGKRTAFTTFRLDHGDKVNHYQERFKQGATIVPRNFYFVEFEGEAPPDLDGRTVTVQTNEEQRKWAKPPWKPLTLRGKVHTDFLFRTGLSKSIVPFAFIDPDLVLLPARIEDDGSVTLFDADELAKEGDLNTAKWFKGASSYWEEHKTDRSKSMSFLDRIDYQRGLSSQDTQAPFLVLYTASAKNANATVVRRDRFDLPFLVESKAYWVATRTEEEAHFLTAFLNADAPNEMIKAFQSRGLFGARDVHKKILEVPFPRYDEGNPRHQRLAELGRKAEAQTAAFLEEEDLSGISNYKLGSLRVSIRKHLADTLAEIDAEVTAVIENQ